MLPFLARNFAADMTKAQAELARSAGALFRRTMEVALQATPFAAIWWGLTGGAPESWLLGAPVVLVATWSSVRLQTPAWWRCRFWGALRFLRYFLVASIRGGIDVAWRALDPRAPLAPGFFEFTMQTEDARARVIFASTVNLLPGTLCAAICDRNFTIHALIVSESQVRALQELERRLVDLLPEEASP